MIKHILKLIWNKKGSNALMILEIFLSFLVLFVVVGYVLFNLDILNKPLGFATEDRWIINLDNDVDLKDSLERAATIENLKRELQGLEEIDEVSFIQSISPFSENSWRNGFGYGTDQVVMSNMFPVDVAYGNVMGVEISEGRWFDETDLESVHIPIIVNRKFVDDNFHGQSMLDSIFTQDSRTWQIKGVVDQIRYKGEFSEETTTIYFLNHFLNNSYKNLDNILLKMRPNTHASVEEKISKTVNSVSKTTGSVISTLHKRKTEKSRHSWLLMIALLSICGFLCINVALGLFGVLSYNINKRKAEIGLRRAIGAHGSDITKQFILEILILTGFAVGLGIFFAIQIPLLEVTEYPASLFYRAIIFATLIILALVFACALFPSLQAAKITPAESLHED